MWIDLSKSLGVKSACFKQCCYPLFHFLNIIEVVLQEVEVDRMRFRLFIITTRVGNKIRVVTSEWEGLYLVGGRLF